MSINAHAATIRVGRAGRPEVRCHSVIGDQVDLARGIEALVTGHRTFSHSSDCHIRADAPGRGFFGFLLAQFRERESRAPFAGIAFCADHTPVHRRPTGRPARSGPPLARGVWPAAKLPRAQKISGQGRPWQEAFGQRPNCRERNRCSGAIMRRHYNVRGHYNVRVCHPERSEGSWEWCRACWRVTKILHLRFRMTGYFASQ